ncbi:MAG TPA: ribokinase [Weissella thailandensis]|uniref:ribokinase n=1 Tax=Weissella thailandensis TaxID=89061 RepID=UPI001D850A29|nr:ribokinase [Weissella thailandensis]HJG85160.1 ribokinase [Weissella thailandensis]
MTRKVTVLGSLNSDTILHIDHLPVQGETMAMSDASTAPGGKGANQAVAAQHLGAQVHFIGAVGQDQNGELLLNALQADGVDTTHIAQLANVGTGAAYILLESDSNNTILILGGANQQVSETNVDEAEKTIQSSEVLVAQFETPIVATLQAFKLAKSAGVMTILNPAPGHKEIPKELLGLTDLITPNETEAKIITGIPVNDDISMTNASNKMQEMGAKNVIITLGERGAYYQLADGHHGFEPALKVKAVDTTAAGDTFIGALATKLAPDMTNLVESVRFASAASALTVQGAGAQPSIPTLKKMKEV